MEHELKTSPILLDDIEAGARQFQIRKDDRDFQVGDTLRLLEYHPRNGRFTGRAVTVRITHMISLEGGMLRVLPGYVGIGTELIKEGRR